MANELNIKTEKHKQIIPIIIRKGDMILKIFYKDFVYVSNSIIFSFFRFKNLSFLFKLVNA